MIFLIFLFLILLPYINFSRNLENCLTQGFIGATYNYTIVNKDEVSLVYMTCKRSFDASRFKIKTYHISCDDKSYDYCYEAVPYLKFIYDHYDCLHGKIIFIHGHEFSWHYSSSVFRIVEERIKSKQFKNDQFGTIYNFYAQERVPWKIEEKFNYLFKYVFHDTPMMDYYNMSFLRFFCCATFFVDARNFLIRPRNLYKLLIDRLIDYSHKNQNPAYFCGRIMEYTWQLLLANLPIVNYSYDK